MSTVDFDSSMNTARMGGAAQVGAGMGTQIRRAEERDIPGINTLLGQVLKVHHLGRPDIFKPQGQKYTDEQLKVILKDESKPVFVCVNADGDVLGHCFCQIIDRPETNVASAYKTLYIDDLCVDEKVRGRHIGTSLYEHVKKFAFENGFYNVTLHAWECNPTAVEFYRHLGMQIQQYTMEEILT